MLLERVIRGVELELGMGATEGGTRSDLENEQTLYYMNIYINDSVFLLKIEDINRLHLLE